MKNKQTKSTSDTITKRLSKVERYVNTHTGDIKNITTAASDTALVAGAVGYLSGCSQGDGTNGRTGNQINLQNIDFNLAFRCTASTNVRIIIFRDKFNVGSMPGTADILESADVLSPVNYLNTIVQKRFVVLYDKTHSFTTGGKLFDTMKVEKPQQYKIRYSGSSNSYSNAAENSLYYLVITDVASTCVFSMYTRLGFTDE